jgi:flagellar hook-associated protein 3 FlgL
MRVSTANTYDVSIDAIARRHEELRRSQEQLSTTKRVNRGSDDPAAAARAERARAGIDRTAANERAVDASRTAMSMAESALGDATNLLQHARETIVGAGNGAYSDAERKALASEIRNVRAQLLQLANSDDGAGGYMFGGQGSSAPPFVDAPGGVQFVGSTGSTSVADDSGLPLTVDGQRTWLQGRTGNGTFETSVVTATGTAWIDSGQVTNPAAVTDSVYTIEFAVDATGATTFSIFEDGVATAQADVAYVSGQAIEINGQSVKVTGKPADGDEFRMDPSTDALSTFDVLDRIATQLESGGRNSGQVAQGTAFGLRDLDAVLARVQSVRSDTGEALNRIDTATGRLEAQKLAQTNERSLAEDLDMVEAISEFQARQSSYDAALKAYSMVQRLSLFNYINP